MMPTANCPQSDAWCPHWLEDECHDVEGTAHALCIHVRSAVDAGMALSVFATLANQQGLTIEGATSLRANAVRQEFARRGWRWTG
jgi:hypothetical protein